MVLAMSIWIMDKGKGQGKGKASVKNAKVPRKKPRASGMEEREGQRVSQIGVAGGSSVGRDAYSSALGAVWITLLGESSPKGDTKNDSRDRRVATRRSDLN